MKKNKMIKNNCDSFVTLSSGKGLQVDDRSSQFAERFCKPTKLNCRLHEWFCRITKLNCRLHKGFCRITKLFCTSRQSNANMQGPSTRWGRVWDSCKASLQN